MFKNSTLGIWGTLAVFALSPFGGGAAMYAVITIIGIPVAILLALAPIIFLFLLLFKIFYIWENFYGSSKVKKVVVSGLLSVAVLAVVPSLINQAINFKILEYKKDDREDLGNVKKVEKIALYTSESLNQDNLFLCGDICQRLLINRQAKSVILFNKNFLTPDGLVTFVPGVEYSLLKSDSCPVEEILYFLRGKKNLTPEDLRYLTKPEKKILETAEKGDCLTQSWTSPSKAEMIFFQENLRNDPEEYGFNIFNNPMQVYRNYIYTNNKESGFSLLYQSTQISATKLFPLLFPTYVRLPAFSPFTPGILKYEDYYGGAQKYESSIGIEMILKKIGYNLEVEY